jgi:hypothetical protein
MDIRRIKIHELDIRTILPNRDTSIKKGGYKIVVLGKPGCLARGTPIKMYDESIKMVEDIKVGDLLLGDDNTVRRVLELCKGYEHMYRVKEISKNFEYIVNKGHILTLYKNNKLYDIPLVNYLQGGYETYFGCRSFGFSIIPYCITVDYLKEDEYFGFVLDGNHRFQLGDNTITHNTGKCLGKGTPIVMFNGSIKKVENVNEGDILMGDDYTPRNVLSRVSGKELLYQVSQDSGISYTVNSSHILSVKRHGKIVDVNVKKVLQSDKGYRNIPTKFNNEKSYIIKSDQLSNLNRINIKCDTFNFLTIDKKSRTDVWKTIFNHHNILLKYHSFYTNYINIANWAHTLSWSIDHKALIKDSSVIGYKYEVISYLDILKRDSILTIHPKVYGDYYGFEIDGNKRFLLGDLTVTHNTTLITSLLYEKRDIFSCGQVISGTEDSNGHYGQFFPPLFIFNKLDEKNLSVLPRFMKRQKLAKAHLPHAWGVELLDDCADKPSILRKDIFQTIFKNGRHYAMLFILSLQYCLDVLPVLRLNVDGVFILRETIKKSIKNIFDNYAAVLDDFDDFYDIMMDITCNYTAIYIDHKANSNKIEDCIFYYDAITDIPKDFKMGCKNYWDYNDARYNTEYTEDFIG